MRVDEPISIKRARLLEVPTERLRSSSAVSGSDHSCLGSDYSASMRLGEAASGFCGTEITRQHFQRSQGAGQRSKVSSWTVALHQFQSTGEARLPG